MEGAVIKLLATSSPAENRPYRPGHGQAGTQRHGQRDQEAYLHRVDSNPRCAITLALTPIRSRKKPRKQEVVEARQIAMYLAKQMTKKAA